jgi:MFS family permease
MLALGFSQQRVLVMASALALGAAQSMARPAFSAMMTDAVPAEDRRRAFGLNYWANNLAFTIAAMLGGLTAGLDFTAVFLVDAATTLVAAVVIFRNAPETRPEAEPDAKGAPAGGQSPLRDPVFLLACVVGFLTMLIFFQYLSTLPLSMVKDGLSAQVYGVVISVNAIMIVLGQLFVPKLTEKWNDTRLLALSTLIVGAGFGLTGLAHSAWMYGLSVVVWTVGEMLQTPASSSILAGLCPPTARGRYFATYSLAMSAASFGAPLLGGYLLDGFGRTVLWSSCFALGAVLALVTLVLGPSRARRIAELKEAAAAPTDLVSA